jgi:hypothetical protein
MEDVCSASCKCRNIMQWRAKVSVGRWLNAYTALCWVDSLTSEIKFYFKQDSEIYAQVKL